MSRVRLDEVSKTYRRGGSPVCALREISLDVADGELVAILGPSGCGKTTLLRVVAGLEHPEAGAIWFADRDVTAIPAERRGAGFVFQSAALYPHLSVFENIAFGPRAHRASAQIVDASVRASARRMRVDESLWPHRPRQLSGGQQQRVALARAVALEPEVLLLDEPLSALDARLRAELRVELSRVHEATGATTLFVTHDQTEALALGHRVAVLRDGRLEQIGSPRELYDAPVSTFVAGFIGTPPMSFVRGTIAGERFVAPGGFSFVASGALPGPATAGIRAVDATLGGDTARGSVRAVEDFGAEAFAYVDGEFGTLAVCCPRGALPHLGDDVGVAIDAARVHLFDVDGRRK
jgi:ABC-type sugar transport system ATPase subunit